MAKKKSTNKVTIFRSAKTGKMVTKKYAKSHPATTVKETRGTGGTGPRKK